MKQCVQTQSVFLPRPENGASAAPPFGGLSGGRCCGDDEDAAVGDKKESGHGTKSRCVGASQPDFTLGARMLMLSADVSVLCFAHTQPFILQI